MLQKADYQKLFFDQRQAAGNRLGASQKNTFKCQVLK